MSVAGLPSLHHLDAGSRLRIWLCTGRTDMRCGFDRLAELARTVTGQDPMSGGPSGGAPGVTSGGGGGHLFVFRNRGGDRLKVLYWDGDGYVLWYKRLEEGVFKLPKLAEDQRSVVLRPSELAMLLDGIDLSSVKRSQRYSRGAAGS